MVIRVVSPTKTTDGSKRERRAIAGKTKASRWSQIGQAMPPGLAEAVGRRIAEWFRFERTVFRATIVQKHPGLSMKGIV